MSGKAPVPPPEFFRQMGHHWLRLRGSEIPTELMVAQWNPGSQTWTHSNGHDRYTTKPLSLEGWEWAAHIPIPDL